jgi:hypothetical protein
VTETTELHGLEGNVDTADVTDDVATTELDGLEGGVNTVDMNNGVATTELDGLEGGVNTVDTNNGVDTTELHGLEGTDAVDVTNDVARTELYGLVQKFWSVRKRENAYEMAGGLLGVAKNTLTSSLTLQRFGFGAISSASMIRSTRLTGFGGTTNTSTSSDVRWRAATHLSMRICRGSCPFGA